MKTRLSVNIGLLQDSPSCHAPMHIIYRVSYTIWVHHYQCAMYARRDMHSHQIVYMLDGVYIIQSCSTFHDFSVLCVASCPQATVTVLLVLLSLVLMLSLSTCTVSAVVHAVMYKRLQRCRAELRGGELCSTPQLSQPLL